MRVAFVETAPYGGLLHYAAQLADALAKRGHDVELLVSRGNELQGRPSGAATMRPVLVPSVRGREAQPRGRLARVARRSAVAFRLTLCWIQITRLARSGRYDMVVINADIYYSVVALAMLAITSGGSAPPVVFICHNARPFSRGRSEELTGVRAPLRLLLGHVFSRLRLILLHGEKSRAEFEASWPDATLATIPHGDERLFGEEPPPAAAEKRVLFFGIWRRAKGIAVLMDAFDLLAARRPEVVLTVAGMPFPEDLDPAELTAWASSHDGRVEVIDHYVPVEEVPALFGRARVVALPYLHAFQSGVVHLAMTMARPVVASDVGDLDSVVADGETGLLVPPGDPGALADALERLLADPETAEHMGAAGRRRVLSGSSWEAVAAQFEEVTTAALASTRRSAGG